MKVLDIWKQIMLLTMMINLAQLEVVQITQDSFLQHLGFQPELLLQSDEYFLENPTQISRPIMIFFHHNKANSSNTALKLFKTTLSQIGKNNDVKTCIAACHLKAKSLCRKLSIITYPTLIRIDKKLNICAFEGQYTEEKLFHFLKNDVNILNGYCSYEDILLGQSAFLKIWQKLPELVYKGQYFQYFTQTIFIIFFVVTLCVGLLVGTIAWKLIPDPPSRYSPKSKSFMKLADQQINSTQSIDS